jgi:hypothetical protein
MLTNIDVLHRAVVKSCGDASSAFTESVSTAFSVLFENDQTIPVNASNLPKNDEANAIPAQLKDAQAAQKTLSEQEKKTEEAQTNLNNKVSNLRDTLGIASQDTSGTAGNSSANGTTGTTGTTGNNTIQGTTNAST